MRELEKKPNYCRGILSLPKKVDERSPRPRYYSYPIFTGYFISGLLVYEKNQHERGPTASS